MTGVMFLSPLIVRQSRDSGNDTDLFTIDSFFGFGLANLDTNQKEPDFTLSVVRQSNTYVVCPFHSHRNPQWSCFDRAVPIWIMVLSSNFLCTHIDQVE